MVDKELKQTLRALGFKLIKGQYLQWRHSKVGTIEISGIADKNTIVEEIMQAGVNKHIDRIRDQQRLQHEIDYKVMRLLEDTR